MTTENDISKFNQYYKEIQNYFDLNISNPHESELEKNDSRSKLAALTETQLLELSSDVHDELQRRESIKNANDVESGLEPIDTFHEKRNIARKKLSLLPNERFDDLLGNIIQEIERRKYYINDGSDLNEKNYENKNENKIRNNQGINVTSTPMKKILSTKDNKEDNIKETVIIPLKVAINSSSDEDEEDQGKKTAKKGQLETSPEIPLPEISKELKILEQKAIKHDLSGGIDDYNFDTQKDKKLFESKTISSTEQLEKQVDFKDSNEFSFNKRLNTMITDVDDTKKTVVMNESNNKNNDSSKEIESLKNENSKLKEELEFLKKKEKNKNKKNRSKPKIPLNHFIDSSGHIPLNLVKNFHHLITHLYLFINKSNHLKNKEEFGRYLFTKTFQISKNLQEIMLLAAIPEAENEIILLRVSFSHLITSIRYYCSFNDLLPEISVNSTISDLCFSFCNLVSVVKIKSTDPKNDNLHETDFILNPNEVTLVNEVDAVELLSPHFSPKVKPLKLAEKFHKIESSTSPIDNNNNNNNNNKKDLIQSVFKFIDTTRKRGSPLVSCALEDTNIHTQKGGRNT